MNLETPTPTIISMLAKLIESVDEIKQDIHELKVEVRQLREEVNQLRVEVNQLREDVNQLRVEVDELRADLNSLRDEFHEFKRDTERRFNDNDEAHQLILSALSEPFTALQDDFKATKKNHGLRLDALEAHLA